MNITIRILSKIEEMNLVNVLIERVWGEKGKINPYLLMAHCHEGGLIIGGFDGEKLVSALYSFPCISNGDIFLYSHLLLVDCKYIGLNIGIKLKEFQARSAIEKGYKKIKWTFDPLESKNAHINFNKLGAVSDKYKENYYGNMRDNLNFGIESDRLIVEWNVNEKRPVEGISLKQCKPIAKVGWDSERKAPIIYEWSKKNVEFISIPIPDNIQQIKKLSLKLVEHWRRNIREMFSYYFSKGYVICGFHYNKNRQVQYYLLHRKVS